MKKNLIKISIFICFLLLGFYNRIVFLRSQEQGFLNLNVTGSSINFTRPAVGELLAGDLVRGELNSKFNNLGIISVRFFNKNRDSKDKIIFRIKEDGSRDWYYKATYDTNQFLPHKFFPFGFPIIKDSQGKKYIFEIESLSGRVGEGIFIDENLPNLLAKSQFSRDEITNNNEVLRYFVVNKLINVLFPSDVGPSAVIFFLPLILYLIFLVTYEVSYQLLATITICLSVYSFLSSETNMFIYYFSVIMLWVISSVRYKFSPKVALIVASVYFVIMMFSQVTSYTFLAELSAVWVNLFILASLVQLTVFKLVGISEEISLSDFFIKFTKVHIKTASVGSRQHMLIEKFILPIMSVYFIVRPLSILVDKFSVFKSFYPENFIVVYLWSMVIPAILLTLLSIFSYVLIKRSGHSNVNVIFVISFVVFVSLSWFFRNSLRFENEPRLTSISPNVVSEAWTDVTIYGMNFRNMPFIGRVFINEKEIPDIVLWSDNRIIFRTVPGSSVVGNIHIIPVGKNESNSLPFEYRYNNLK